MNTTTVADTLVATETTLQVEGMTCASCVARVETLLRKVPGVSGATASHMARREY